AQRQIHALTQKMSESGSGVLRKIFRPLAQYPLLTTTMTDLSGKAMLAIAAVQQRDWRFIAATALWSNGDLGVICKDENLLSWTQPANQKLKVLPRLEA
ncbi:MAG: hypothetical protein DMG79_22365, partial [Acidobacteria bacterium]